MTDIREATATDQQNTQPFFDAHKETLQKLFQVLDREHEWTGDLDGIIDYTQQKWVGNEHGASQEKDSFEPYQESSARELFPHLGLAQEIVPPKGEYEQVHIIGGFMRVNRERIGFVKRLLETQHVLSENIVFWAGQRMRDSRDDKFINLDAITAGAEGEQWIQTELAKSEEHSWKGRFATETELARLALLEHYPSASLRGMVKDMDPKTATGVPGHSIRAYLYDIQGAEFTVLNARAVDRKGGPRHTTASCAEEWLNITPPSLGAKVLLISGNPHTKRTDQDVREILNQRARCDIEMTSCGPAANPNATTQLYLGEIGRLLHNDLKVKALQRG
jgi:hypothetical protein